MQAYHLPAEVSGIARLPQPLPPGVPSESEYVRMYCKLCGVEPPSAQTWAFYVALSIFRAAAILAGVHARSLQGNASAANAGSVGAPAIVDQLARTALDLIASSTSKAQGAPADAPRQQSASLPAASRSRRALWPRPPTTRVKTC